MTLNIQKNNSESIKLDKDLTDILSLTGYMQEPSSIYTPEFLVKMRYSDYDNSEMNYLTVPDLKRSYFITDVVAEQMDLFRIYAKCDVLSSFADEIRANRAVIARQQNYYNRYLNDSKFKIQQNYQVVTRRLDGEGFGQAGFVLVTSGQSA